MRRNSALMRPGGRGAWECCRLQKQWVLLAGEARPLGCLGETAARVGCATASCPAAMLGCPAPQF